jgi:arsenite methyltransferase
MTALDRDRDAVRERYAAAARRIPLPVVDDACGPADACCGADAAACGPLETSAVFGPVLYTGGEGAEVPAEAMLASLGCGNPTAVADLRPGETVLDLGSGGGIDVLLSARRVGPTGYVYGVDMTDEMLALAEANRVRAGVDNVSFLRGHIEELPLGDASVDVVISNCVINLSGAKDAVVAEMFRVLRPGGRVGVSDVVAEDHLSEEDRRRRGSLAGCVAGAYSRGEYVAALTAAGFTRIEVEFTHEVVPEMHGAIVRAVKPALDPA